MNENPITLADVDGTIPGRAALLSINLDAPGGDNGGPLYELVIEGEGGCTDPLAWVQGLWRSIEADWTGHTVTFASNHRAKYLASLRNLAAFGMADGYDPAEYVKSHNDECARKAEQTRRTTPDAGEPGTAREGAAQ